MTIFNITVIIKVEVIATRKSMKIGGIFKIFSYYECLLSYLVEEKCMILKQITALDFDKFVCTNFSNISVYYTL